MPRDLGTLNCGAFCAGVVHGCLESAGFPATVQAYAAPVEGAGPNSTRTNILIAFTPAVMERERAFGS